MSYLRRFGTAAMYVWRIKAASEAKARSPSYKYFTMQPQFISVTLQFFSPLLVSELLLHIYYTDMLVQIFS